VLDLASCYHHCSHAAFGVIRAEACYLAILHMSFERITVPTRAWRHRIEMAEQEEMGPRPRTYREPNAVALALNPESFPRQNPAEVTRDVVFVA
jgi:hypothetical protein